MSKGTRFLLNFSQTNYHLHLPFSVAVSISLIYQAPSPLYYGGGMSLRVSPRVKVKSMSNPTDVHLLLVINRKYTFNNAVAVSLP